MLYNQLLHQRKKANKTNTKSADNPDESHSDQLDHQIKDLLSSVELVIIRLVKKPSNDLTDLDDQHSDDHTPHTSITSNPHNSHKRVDGCFIQSTMVHNIKCEVHWVDLDQFVEVMQDLAAIHYHLKSLRITGIPMKKEHNRANYDVVLLYPSDSHLTHGGYVDYLPLGSRQCLDKNELKLQWKTTEKGYDFGALDCTCVHRLTPLSVCFFCIIINNPNQLCILSILPSCTSLCLSLYPHTHHYDHIITILIPSPSSFS